MVDSGALAASQPVRAASQVLDIVLRKTDTSRVATGAAELRLKSGDVDADDQAKVVWSASVNAAWLQLDTTRGSVYSNEPVAALLIAISSPPTALVCTTRPSPDHSKRVSPSVAARRSWAAAPSLTARATFCSLCG
jgi:hypothetical protein